MDVTMSYDFAARRFSTRASRLEARIVMIFTRSNGVPHSKVLAIPSVLVNLAKKFRRSDVGGVEAYDAPGSGA